MFSGQPPQSALLILGGIRYAYRQANSTTPSTRTTCTNTSILAPAQTHSGEWTGRYGLALPAVPCRFTIHASMSEVIHSVLSIRSVARSVMERCIPTLQLCDLRTHESCYRRVLVSSRIGGNASGRFLYNGIVRTNWPDLPMPLMLVNPACGRRPSRSPALILTSR